MTPNIDYKTEYYEKMKPNYKDFDEFLPDYWQMKYFDRWADILELLPQDKIIDISVLDIGCGMGRAIRYFNGFGAKCLGVEPSDYAAGIARERGVEVVNDYFENVAIDSLFDIVHIEQVLSHTPVPQMTLTKAFKLLADDGVLVVEEPNDGNALQEILRKEHGTYWITPDHANYFSFESLEKVLNTCGFDVVLKTCTYPMELFEVMGDKYIGNEAKGREVHRKRYQMESSLSPDLRKKLMLGFAGIGLGRDIILYARKVN